MVRFAQDARGVADVCVAELEAGSTASQDLSSSTTAPPCRPTRVTALEQAAKALLGEDFRIIPEFALTAAQGDELENALAPAARATCSTTSPTRPS